MFSKSVFRRPGVTRHFCNQFAINAGLPEPYELDQPSDGGRPGAGAGASRLDKDVIFLNLFWSIGIHMDSLGDIFPESTCRQKIRQKIN